MKIRKKKIGVITLCNSINFGGTLQAYALYKALNKIGLNPTLIKYQKPIIAWNSIGQYLRLRKRLYGVNIIRMAGGCLKTLFSNIHFFQKKKKIERFVKFRNSNLIMTPYYKEYKDLVELGNCFDGYITGSDQVWNIEYTNNKFDPAYMLEFVDSNKPCFSYAASVGGDKDREYLVNLMNKTRKFRMISVRENSLAKKLNELGEKRVFCHIDPVFLLSKTEWKTIEIKPNKKIPNHYILIYYIEMNPKKDILIDKILKTMNLPIIDISSYGIIGDMRFIHDREAGPGEFVYYIRHADFVVTNSFHAVAFSVIFNINFLAVPRCGQESRVRDFLEDIGLQHRILKENQWEPLLETIFLDENILSDQIRKAYDYLREIRNIINENN